MAIPSRFNIHDDDPELLRRFTAYIELVVKHARIDYLRGNDRHMQTVSLDENQLDETLAYEDPTPQSKIDFDFEEDKLSKVFSRQTLLRQEILKHIFVYGLSVQETADKLNCSTKYVYQQKRRVLIALRDQLIEEGYKRGE